MTATPETPRPRDVLLGLVDLCAALPPGDVRRRLDSAVDDLIRRTLRPEPR